jgi:hypothetical protein
VAVLVNGLGSYTLTRTLPLEKRTHTRFVVTSKKKVEPRELYDWYVKRGETEG